MMDSTDERLAAALYDVPVPEGLAERILECLGNEESAIVDSSSLVHRFPRRWLLLSGGLLATAVGLLIAVWLGMQRGEGLSEQYVLDEAIRSFDEAMEQPGQLLAEKSCPDAYPFSSAVLQIRGTRWRTLGAFLGCRGVVYDLPGSAGVSAALYVVDAEAVEGLGESPAWHPFTTAGCCASAWRENGLLYVLVVQGDPATYRVYLNLPNEPVA